MKRIQETHLYREIHEQPDVIRRLINDQGDVFSEIAEKITSQGIRHIFIAARGTSDNAGRYAKYLLGAHNRLVISLATPSLFTIYNQPPDLSDSLVLGISQSGKSPDIVSVLKEGEKQGAITAAITNVPNSDLGQAAQFVIDLQAGEELSLAATKTYTAQLTSLAILSTKLNPDKTYLKDLLQLPNHIAAAYLAETHIKHLAERYRYMSHCVVIGRGFNYASAFELSLKMSELTYTIAEPYSSADFLHGPVALVDQGFPTFVIAPEGKMTSELKALIEKVHQRHAEVIVFSDNDDLLRKSPLHVQLPGGVPEWLSPISAIIPGQMFAMYLAEARGFDVDNPRGLRKVTETW